MRHRDDFPHVVRRDIRSNIQSQLELQILIAPQPRPFVTVIDWWSWYTEAESGAWDTGDALALMEGPWTPQHTFSFNANQLRDNRELRVLDHGHPTGGVATDPVGATAALGYPFHNYGPHGIMTVFEVMIGWETGDGVHRLSTSVGWHRERVAQLDWDYINQHGLNVNFTGESIVDTPA